MTDDELLRYSRHILMPAIDVAGQARIRAARVLVVGAGGLGAPVAMYLAAAGVGRLVLADDDTVDLTNLQRQIIHGQDRIGQLKVESAQRTLAALNPQVEVVALPERLAGEALRAQVAEADLVVDCCDNFATRHAINLACVQLRRPLVSGAAVQFDGQLAVFDLRQADSPCYHCLFPDTGGTQQDMPCAIMGVFAPLVGVVGSWQAAEALKLIVGCGTALVGRLLLLDLLHSGVRAIRVARDPACPVCGAR